MKRKQENFDSDFPFRIRTLEAMTGFFLWQVSYLWGYEQKRALQRFHNISHMDYVALASTYWLTLEGKEVTQIFLSRHTKIEPMGISQLLKSLESRGLMERECSGHDSRAKVLKVTEKGIDLLKSAIITIEALDERFFKVLGKKIPLFNSMLSELIKENE
ncbi:MAG: MarR family winged helix-turn-helix transcriptional regulator [Prevotellaceae bacterium]|jgi:DNA-binding MarR family transcriptional regulator|nr:MarR family winged helix-turn-helix transcriptional regulator [Prevotellaceae bacterium]